MILFDGLRRLFRFRRSSLPADREGPASADAGDARDAAEGTRALELYQNAIQCCERGEPDAAVRLLQQAIRLQHDFAEAHFLLGNIYHRRGRLDDASDCYVLATCFDPGLMQAHYRLGLLMHDQGRFDEARVSLEKALQVAPDSAEAYNALGAALLGAHDIDAAVSHFRRALELKPEFVEAHSNLGYVLFRDFEQFDEGSQHIETALKLAPDNEAALCNWTMVLKLRGRSSEALELADRLLSTNPDLHELRLNRALILLTRGEFRQGWRDYEARKHLRDFPRRRLPWPEWDGAPLAGRTIFVCAEQGLGDEIMFASCLPDVMRAARRCVVECSPKLENLFRRSFPAADVVAKKGDRIEAGKDALLADVHCQTALGSLPRFLRNEVADFPRHGGYLKADPTRVARWKNRLDELGSGVKVGISWRGGLASTRRSLRSIALEQWLPILCCDKVTFISLQYTNCRDEIAALEANAGVIVHHWKDALDDYDETAALVCALDLVITVQTAVAHLAGALGKTTWVMISALPEWRYRERGERVPWYPAMRLIRQAALNDWHPVIERIAEDLTAWVRSDAAAFRDP